MGNLINLENQWFKKKDYIYIYNKFYLVFSFYLYIYFFEINIDSIIDKSHNMWNTHEIIIIILILNIFFHANLIKLIKIQIIAFKNNQC
jgi:hypothetical protein